MTVVGFALTGVLFAGCAPLLGDAQAREADRSVPEDFGQSLAPGGPQSSADLQLSDFFRDPNLLGLVDQALTNNQELLIVDQEVSIAGNEVMARYGEFLPQLGVGAEAGIEKVGRYTSQGASDEADEIKDGRNVPENLQNYGVGFFASWEVDIWKKLRNATKAAVFRRLATVEGKRFLVTRLVAEIARSYYELMALDNQLEVLQRNIQIQNDALQVVRVNKEAGRVTELAVQRFEAEVLNTRSRVYDIQQEIVQVENRINLLVGRFPQPVERSSSGFLEFEPVAMNTGVPMQLLENRPDVKQAEMGIEASKLDVQVAKARFYPALNIDAGVGIEAFELSSLGVMPESLFYNAFAGITAPLLNRKVLTAGYFAANSRQMQAVYRFEQTLRKAFTETANQIARLRNLGQKYELKSQQAQILTNAIEVSNQLFSSARADYMEVLLTRRDALDAQMEVIETRKLQLGAMVDMYQALGGGWKEAVPPDDSADTVDAGGE